MKRFEPIPEEEGKALVHRLVGKSLEEIVAMLGPPIREHGPSPRYGQTPEPIGQYTKILEYIEVSPSVKRLLVKVREDGKLEFEFRGQPLIPPSNQGATK